MQDDGPYIIKNPLVAGDELWDALSFLAPRLGIEIKNDGDITQPCRRLPEFSPLFSEPPR